MIPIPILVPTGAGIDSKVELVPELEPALMNRKKVVWRLIFKQNLL